MAYANTRGAVGHFPLDHRCD